MPLRPRIGLSPRGLLAALSFIALHAACDTGVPAGNGDPAYQGDPARPGVSSPEAGVMATPGTGVTGKPDTGAKPVEVKPGEVVPGDSAEDFLSHVPGRSMSGADAGSAGLLGGGGAGGTGGASGSPAAGGADNDAANRAITEADILKREGDTLYALSRYAGLSVIDIANPKQLRLLGNLRNNAEPFEMYLRGGVAYVMYNNYGRYTFDEQANGWTYNSSSHVTALDVSDPAQIKVLGDHEVPGSISDSRLVGDVLYLVTFENGYCWNCATNPNTRVASFDVGDPARFDKIDEVRFEDAQPGGWQRSISVTTARIYVGGPNWSDRDSDIRVVDIADPAGDLVLGATIPLHGSVQNRWQMDEHEGVLRVISQPTAWRTNDPPYVQTFRVESSQKVTRLASLAVRLPRPESLRSVRFDGHRAYAITAEQIDPLFTFDLSDPARPRQLGELEMPGFVYHMEPRGNRVYALGFDNMNTAGSLHVSIFDVSNLAAPTMLDRVNFGGDWASLAEDQDRIHKAFNILLDQGLILVPFSGGDYDDTGCNYTYQSGIQLIDVAGDDLKLRGVAPQIGSARRSFVHRAHLFGITDNALSVFDIADRDHPSATAQLEVARNISQVHVMGDTLLRFGTDWWTPRSIIDFTALDAANTAEPIGELDLASVVAGQADSCTSSAHWESQLYVHGDVAYAPRRTYRYSRTGFTRGESLDLYIVDLRDRSAPKVAGVIETQAAAMDESLGGVVITEHALLIGRVRGYYNYGASGSSDPKYSYDIYDLHDPLAPAFKQRFEVPSRLAAGGWGWGFGGCGVSMPWGYWFSDYGSTSALVSGDLVVSQHEEDVADGTGRVRYYLDRLDVSDPAQPRLLPVINIPGQVVHFDGEAQSLVTMEYMYSERSGLDWSTCYAQSSRAWMDGATCRIYRRRANALVLEGDTARRVSQLDLDTDTRVSQTVSVTGERLFVTTSDKRTPSNARAPITTLDVYAYADSGQFVKHPGVELGDDPWGTLYAFGTRVFTSSSGSLTVIDTGNPEAPTKKRHEIQGWGCDSIEVQGERAYCALGQYGALTIDL
jgi:hypothetical protein